MTTAAALNHLNLLPVCAHARAQGDKWEHRSEGSEPLWRDLRGVGAPPLAWCPRLWPRLREWQDGPPPSPGRHTGQRWGPTGRSRGWSLSPATWERTYAKATEDNRRRPDAHDAAVRGAARQLARSRLLERMGQGQGDVPPRQSAVRAVPARGAHDGSAGCGSHRADPARGRAARRGEFAIVVQSMP